MASNVSVTGYTNEQIDAPYELFPCTTYCAFCPDWAFDGTTAEAREAAREHRRTHHPEIREKHSRRNRLHMPDPDQIKAAVARRASQTNECKILMTAHQERGLLALYREGYPVTVICRMRWKRMGYASAESLEASFYRMLRRRGITPRGSRAA